MKKRWYYIYVIVYPALGYQFYYGSRITPNQPELDNYWGSSVTFCRYNDPDDPEYQADARKVILQAQLLPHTKKHAAALGAREAKLIADALQNVTHLGPNACLNRNYGGRIVLSSEERAAACSRGGRSAMANKAGIHSLSGERLAEFRQRGGESTANKHARVFTIVSPAGEAVVFKNIRAFCRENNLNRANVQSVLRNERPTVNGWRAPPSHREQL